MSPIHCSPEEAVKIHKEINAKQSIATHFGTFPLADDGKEDALIALRKALQTQGVPAEQFIILKEGEGMDFWDLLRAHLWFFTTVLIRSLIVESGVMATSGNCTCSLRSVSNKTQFNSAGVAPRDLKSVLLVSVFWCVLKTFCNTDSTTLLYMVLRFTVTNLSVCGFNLLWVRYLICRRPLLSFILFLISLPNTVARAP